MALVCVIMMVAMRAFMPNLCAQNFEGPGAWTYDSTSASDYDDLGVRNYDGQAPGIIMDLAHAPRPPMLPGRRRLSWGWCLC